MINKDLKTNNKIVKAINEKYPVMAWIGCHEHKPNSFVIYENVHGQWPPSMDKMKYMATVVADGENNVEWNGVHYFDADQLLTEIEQYNQTLDFPAWTANPQYNLEWRFGAQIDWYLTEKFHMKRNKANQTYYIGDEDTPVFSVYVQDAWTSAEANAIEFRIFGSKLYQSFLDAKEACQNIGSLYTAAVAHAVKIANGCVKCLPEDTELNDCGNLKVWNSGTWEFMSAKDMLIEKLEKLLADLKNA